jgi:hypothetical protein
MEQSEILRPSQVNAMARFWAIAHRGGTQLLDDFKRLYLPPMK